METLEAPYLLLAAPDMLDPNFAHTVVLMGHHTSEGAIGWIVNRVIERKVLGELPAPLEEAIHPETPLRLGGPVLTNGLVVVFRGQLPEVESVRMAPGLSVSASPDILSKLFATSPDLAPKGLLIFGYSGWGPGQLEREMSEGAWLVLPYEEEFAFPMAVDGLWEKALARLGVKPESVSTPPGGVN